MPEVYEEKCTVQGTPAFMCNHMAVCINPFLYDGQYQSGASREELKSF